MQLNDVVDEMDASIAMFLFMSTAVPSIHNLEQPVRLNDEETFGMQKLFEHIEAGLKDIRDCIEANLPMPLQQTRKSGISKQAV